MSIAIASSNFILVSLFVCTRRIYFMSSDDLLFLLFFITHSAKTLACKLNTDLKANLNRHPYVIQPRSELGSKSYIFMENDKTVSLANLLQHLLFGELYLNEKFNSYYDI